MSETGDEILITEANTDIVFWICGILLVVFISKLCRFWRKTEIIDHQVATPCPSRSIPLEVFAHPHAGVGTTNNVYVDMSLPQGILEGPSHSQINSVTPLPGPVDSEWEEYPFPDSVANNNRDASGARDEGPAQDTTQPRTGSTSSNDVQIHSQSAIPNQQPMADLPPPYHVAVGTGAPIRTSSM